MQLNEGLEKLGAREIIDRWKYEGGVFRKTAIESIWLPSTLKKIEDEMFYGCKNLKSVEIPSSVEYVGKECFAGTQIEELTLPSTLKEIGEGAFKDCEKLEAIWVEEGCTPDIRKCAADSVVILPAR